MKEVYNGLPEIAAHLDMTEKTLRRMKEDDPSFPIYKVAGHWRYISGDYPEWVRVKAAESDLPPPGKVTRVPYL